MVKKTKNQSIKKAIYAKTPYRVEGYCQVHGLSYECLRKGYISEKARAQFEKDGIVIEDKA
jgi:hypothetical protein